MLADLARIAVQPRAAHAASADELMSKIAAGDKAALTALHALYNRSLYRVARRILGSRECAEEIVADVFIYVWHRAAFHDASRGSVEAWLRIITRHRAIDRYRTYRRHLPLAEDWVDDEPSISLFPPEQTIVESQTREMLHAALSSLTPLRRQLVALAFFDGLTHAEISLSTGLPLGTVKSHVKRALTGLRHAMSGGLAPLPA